jgi:peptidoglycan/LPS O-acetylase OafA/YrhL
VGDRQGRGGAIVAGAILIALGVYFLLRDRLGFDFGLVWPFFLIVPGAYLVARSLFTGDRSDRTGGFIGGGILLMLGGVFLFDDYVAIDWNLVWPFFLIIPGIGLLFGVALGRERREPAAPIASPVAQPPPPPEAQPAPMAPAAPDDSGPVPGPGA